MKKKTLVFHPDDRTTDFLKEIYRGRSFDVETTWTMPKERFKQLIESHDRIMFMGHGGPYGLFGYCDLLMNKEMIEILKTKETVCIWCNADKYVEREGLKGFYTGMFISEVEEAHWYGMVKTQEEISYSNYLFVRHFRNVLNSKNILTEIKNLYTGECEVIKFNNERLYHTNNPVKRDSSPMYLLK